MYLELLYGKYIQWIMRDFQVSLSIWYVGNYILKFCFCPTLPWIYANINLRFIIHLRHNIPSSGYTAKVGSYNLNIHLKCCYVKPCFVSRCILLFSHLLLSFNIMLYTLQYIIYKHIPILWLFDKSRSLSWIWLSCKTLNAIPFRHWITTAQLSA